MARRNLLDILSRAAARVLEDPDPDVQEIGHWLAAGASGDPGRWLDSPNGVGKPWRRELQIKARDHTIIAAVNKYWPDLNATEQARNLLRGLERYKDAIWPTACEDLTRCPHPKGSAEENYWNMLRSSDRDIGVQQMARRIRGVRGK